MLKFSCEKALLQQAVSAASRAVASKSSIPALEGILMEGDMNLTLSGYNMQTGIRTAIEAQMNAGSWFGAQKAMELGFIAGVVPATSEPMALSSPIMAFSNVLFPEPDVPIMVTNSPSYILKLIPRKALTISLPT